MAPVTEFVALPVNPDSAPDVVAAVIKENIQTLLAQPGCQRVRQSRVHEEPSKLRLFADWASIEAHRAFAANSAAYGSFQQRMRPVVDVASFGPSNPRRPPFHIAFAAHPPSVLDGGASPVAEVFQAYFAPDVSDEARAKVEATVTAFLRKLEAETEGGLTGESALGWSVETDVLFKGEPSRVFVAAIGWTSIEAHMRVCDTEAFQTNISMVRTLEGMKGREFCHVSNTTIESSN
ncbi:hypothetical protein F4781DRAFT_257507 [Annulohypoxylon bovei var. microspora]|nr:hypothetical protein F4781DRAFT_257507 [Annulohypoxylon bovei var. microspora]